MDLFEIILILAVALIVIPPERLPEVMRAAGKVMRELRAASNSVIRELGQAFEEEPERVQRPEVAPESRKTDQPPESR